MVKLAIEEVKGVCPQGMSGIRDKLILCMDRPRAWLSSNDQQLSRFAKHKAKYDDESISVIQTKPVW